MREKMTISKNIITVFGAALLLAGCSDFGDRWDTAMDGAFSSKPQPPQAVATEPDIVSIKLAQAADKASHSLDVIANIEQQKNPSVPPMQDDYANASPSMLQPVSLRWSGPLEQVSRTLAEHAGMRFRVKGRQPAAPVIVNLDVYQEPMIHVMRDIGMQAGTRADLSIDANEGVVEVRYAAADQSR